MRFCRIFYRRKFTRPFSGKYSSGLVFVYILFYVMIAQHVLTTMTRDWLLVHYVERLYYDYYCQSLNYDFFENIVEIATTPRIADVVHSINNNYSRCQNPEVCPQFSADRIMARTFFSRDFTQRIDRKKNKNHLHTDIVFPRRSKITFLSPRWKNAS